MGLRTRIGRGVGSTPTNQKVEESKKNVGTTNTGWEPLFLLILFLYLDKKVVRPLRLVAYVLLPMDYITEESNR